MEKGRNLYVRQWITFIEIRLIRTREGFEEASGYGLRRQSTADSLEGVRLALGSKKFFTNKTSAFAYITHITYMQKETVTIKRNHEIF